MFDMDDTHLVLAYADDVNLWYQNNRKKRICVIKCL